jgi:hypothetical protein
MVRLERRDDVAGFDSNAIISDRWSGRRDATGRWRGPVDRECQPARDIDPRLEWALGADNWAEQD